MITPDPRPGWRNSPRGAPGVRPKNWSKKSLKNGSCEGPGPISGRWPLATWTVPMWTTAGLTRSATLTKAACRASAVMMGDRAGVAGARRPNQNAWAQKPPPIQTKTKLTRSIARAVVGIIGLPPPSLVPWRFTVKEVIAIPRFFLDAELTIRGHCLECEEP